MKRSGDGDLSSAPLLGPESSAFEPVTSKKTLDRLGTVIDKVNSSSYRVDRVANIPFQLITAYDSNDISNVLAGFIVKVNQGVNAKTTDYLSQELVLLVLGIRFGLAICNFTVERLEEERRFEKQRKRKEKLISRYEQFLIDYGNLLSDLKKQVKEGKTPEWSDFSALIFYDVLNQYAQNDKTLSLQDEHLFYSVLRYALPPAEKESVFEKLRAFKANNNEHTRSELNEAVQKGLAARIKKRNIIQNKYWRSFIRQLKRVGLFILANIKGLSLVTVLASYIAIFPFITVFMVPVYISALVIGLAFAFLKVLRDVIEHKHTKIDKKFQEEKGRYKQNRALKKLKRYFSLSLFSLQKTKDNDEDPIYYPKDEEINRQEDLGARKENQSQKSPIDGPEPVEMGASGASVFQKGNQSQKNPISDGGYLIARLIPALIITIATSSVSGWWAVFTVSEAVAFLGGPALIGSALIVLPILSAVAVTLFALSQSLVAVYREHLSEQREINALRQDWNLQQEHRQSNPVLNQVCQLSDAELLENYISEYFGSVDPENPKENLEEFLENLKKFIRAKPSKAREMNDFYNYLLFKLVEDSHADSEVLQRAKVLVSKLKVHMGDRPDNLKAVDPTLKISETFLKRPRTRSKKFIKGFNIFAAIVIPVIIGLGVAAAFAAGPTFVLVSLGMVALLGITSLINARLTQGYKERRRERDYWRARMNVCDETALLLLHSGHKPSIRPKRRVFEPDALKSAYSATRSESGIFNSGLSDTGVRLQARVRVPSSSQDSPSSQYGQSFFGEPASNPVKPAKSSTRDFEEEFLSNQEDTCVIL